MTYNSATEPTTSIFDLVQSVLVNMCRSVISFRLLTNLALLQTNYLKRLKKLDDDWNINQHVFWNIQIKNVVPFFCLPEHKFQHSVNVIHLMFYFKITKSSEPKNMPIYKQNISFYEP